VNKEYKICSKTVMDTTDSDITFDNQGVSNHAIDFIEKSKLRIIDPEKRDSALNNLVKKIKADGKQKEYDCIIGVSGGTDSTYVAYLVKKMGLRPLAVHLDNGWDSELAVDNIDRVLKKLDIDLYTHVMDWEEFKGLQLSFLYASTPDLEIPTDHAINATLFQTAAKFDVKYILSGSNFNDEGIWPESWAYGHLDWKYIKGIHKLFMKNPLTTYPHISLPKLFYTVAIKRIKTIAILNYLSFEKYAARKLLEEQFDWRDYGGKHNESQYSKFVQEYILPKKFNIDVRKAYLSAPILRGQITRDEALDQLKEPIATAQNQDNQREYFLRKMGLSSHELEQIMAAPVKSRFDYTSNIKLTRLLRSILNKLRKFGLAST